MFSYEKLKQEEFLELKKTIHKYNLYDRLDILMDITLEKLKEKKMLENKD